MSHRGRVCAMLGIGIVAVLGVWSLSFAQTVAPTNSAPNPYRSIDNWAKLPDGRTWGSTAGVDIDPDGTSVWIAERCGAYAPPSQFKPGEPFACDGSNLDPILKFDASGKLVKSFGAGMFILPHGIHVDHAGNVWATDGIGGNGKGHQVIKFSPDGKVVCGFTTAAAPRPAMGRRSIRSRNSTPRENSSRASAAGWSTGRTAFSSTTMAMSG